MNSVSRDGGARLRMFLGKELRREAILPAANKANREASPTLQRTHQITSLLPRRDPDEKPNLWVTQFSLYRLNCRVRPVQMLDSPSRLVRFDKPNWLSGKQRFAKDKQRIQKDIETQ